MDGFFARLRRRTKSFTPHSQTHPPVHAPSQPVALVPTAPFPSSATTPRKIHPNLDALITDNPGPSTSRPADASWSSQGSGGLKPRRHSVDGNTRTVQHPRTTPPAQSPHKSTDRVSDAESPTPAPAPTPTPSHSRSRSHSLSHQPSSEHQRTSSKSHTHTHRVLSQISQLTSSSQQPPSPPPQRNWRSTFGRTRTSTLVLAEFGSGPGSGSGGESPSPTRPRFTQAPGISPETELTPNESSPSPIKPHHNHSHNGRGRGAAWGRDSGSSGANASVSASTSTSPPSSPIQSRRGSRTTSFTPPLPHATFSPMRPISAFMGSQALARVDSQHTSSTGPHSTTTESSRPSTGRHRRSMTPTTATDTNTHSRTQSNEDSQHTHDSFSSSVSAPVSVPALVPGSGSPSPSRHSSVDASHSSHSPHLSSTPAPVTTQTTRGTNHDNDGNDNESDDDDKHIFETPKTIHTFGIPTPPSTESRASLPRKRYSPPEPEHDETIPPVPPLDHPVFGEIPITGGSSGITEEARTSGHEKGKGKGGRRRSLSVGAPTDPSSPSARLGHGLPSLSLPFSLAGKGKGKAAQEPADPAPTLSSSPASGSQSQTTFTPGMFRSRTSSTSRSSKSRRGRSWSRGPGKAGTKRSRTQSTGGASTSARSERRASADWSAYQAGVEDTWQAEVVREILKISLGFDESMGMAGAGIGQAHQQADSDKRLVTTAARPRDNNDPGRSGTEEDEHGLILSLSLNRDNLSDTQGQQTRIPDRSSQNSEHKAMPLTDHDRTLPSTTNPSPFGQDTPVTPAPSSSKQKSDRRSAQRPQVSTSATLLQLPALEFTAPTPDASPGKRSASEPVGVGMGLRAGVGAGTEALKVPGMERVGSSGSGKGKRKAEEVEGGTPPKDKEREGHRATFAVEPRRHRQSANSGSSNAPSSYHRKRARLSTSESLSPIGSHDRENAATSGTLSSRSSSLHQSTSASPHPPVRALSRASARATSIHSVARSQTTSARHQHNQHPSSAPRRSLSMSQASIPISALISPHAPSVELRSHTYHMRDPRRPPRPFETPWSLAFPVAGEPGSGSPVQAWLFFAGFVLFPLWWLASFWRIPRTRSFGAEGDGRGGDVEKVGAGAGAVVLDDPQVEFDAKSWRFRCRVMAIISFFTYIPFIVLVAVFAPR